jgi:hypothetical protein
MISDNRKGPTEIVNPVKLDAARRDSVCAQCHLTGAARIPRAQAKDETYRPGALLSDYFAYFVWIGGGSSIKGANSHFENLQQSSCKRESGERLWCGSCHDPHGEPEPLKRIDFYRSRCQKCHELAACKEDLKARRQARSPSALAAELDRSFLPFRYSSSWRSASVYATIPFTTSPWTSVSRKSLPA